MAKILVIEDDKTVRRVIRRILETKGYSVSEAGDGKEGINRFLEDPADLVLTDIVMPTKEGLETIRELKETSPDVKIIAMSGGGRNNPYDYLNLAKKFGAARVFEKPFEWDDLIDAISELLA